MGGGENARGVSERADEVEQVLVPSWSCQAGASAFLWRVVLFCFVLFGITLLWPNLQEGHVHQILCKGTDAALGEGRWLDDAREGDLAQGLVPDPAQRVGHRD